MTSRVFGPDLSQRPDVSLIVCMCNQAHLADIVLGSIAEQRAPFPFEVIVCDDGSNDSLFTWLRQSRLASLNVRYVWQPRNGHRVSRSRNNAIRCAQGRLLVFSDGDQWLPPDFVVSHASAHRSDRLLVCGLRCGVLIDGSDPCPRPSLQLLRDLQRDPDDEPTKQRRWIASNQPWMACLSCNFSIQAGHDLHFDERFESWGSEDRDFAFRACAQGLRPVLLDAPNAIHLTTRAGHWSTMGHEAIVTLLRNKRYLAEKYPGGEMTPSLALIRHCHLDSRTNRWSMGVLRERATIADVFREFEEWNAGQSFESPRARSVTGALRC